MQDQLILGALLSFLTESMLTHVANCVTSREVWGALERLFTSHSHTRSLQFHLQLSTLKKGTSSISDYLQTFTTLADTLAAVDWPLSPFEVTSFLLAGLGLGYDAFVTSVSTRVEPLSMEDLYGHLFVHEQRIAHTSSTAMELTITVVIFFTRGWSNRGHGGLHPQIFVVDVFGHQLPPRVPCHMLLILPSINVPGGVVDDLSFLSLVLFARYAKNLVMLPLTATTVFYDSFQKDATSNMQSYVVAPQPSGDPNWYSNFGATHHMISDLQIST